MMAKHQNPKLNGESRFRDFVEQRWLLWLIENGIPKQQFTQFFQWGPVFDDVKVIHQTLDNGERVVSGMSVSIYFQSKIVESVLQRSAEQGLEQGENELSSIDRFLFSAVDVFPLFPELVANVKKEMQFQMEYQTGNSRLQVNARK